VSFTSTPKMGQGTKLAEGECPSKDESEKDKALVALRREAVELSLAAASKLIGERMDSDTDRRLVVDYLDSVEIKH